MDLIGKHPGALSIVGRDQFTEVVANVVADKSDGTARKYAERLRHFAAWLREEGRPLDKRTVAAYRRHLASEGKAPSTINGHLVAVRALLMKAADMGLIPDRRAERMARVKGVKQRGDRVGNWLTKVEAQRLLDAPDTDTLKGKRDRAILAVMLFCGLRRLELATLTLGHLQERDGHNVIADLIGKGGRVRTVKMPVPVKRVIDEWLRASGRELQESSLVFVAMRKGDHLAEGGRITDQALYNLVRQFGVKIGHPKLSPHDLRRTFAKLARKGGAALEDISLALGHASIATTERYLGTELNLDHAAPDAVKLRLKTRNQRVFP